MTARHRKLADAAATLLIVYTTAADAAARGYERWLREVDNPFFNRIPGVHHYANWRIDSVLAGAPLPYTHVDFQGLARAEDLQRVWFNPDLDAFRKEWIRLWGYGSQPPAPAVAYAYLMRACTTSGTSPTELALVRGGPGQPPSDGDFVWQITHVLPKHFAQGGRSAGDRWLLPAAETNPLGLAWVALDYGTEEEALLDLYRRRPAAVAFLASEIAAP